jgi:putative transposase
MQRMQAFKYRLDVRDGDLATQLSRTVGCCRFVWNRAVALSRERYPGFKALCALLPSWKRELPWLAEVDSIALQQSLRNFDRAWQNYFQAPEHFARPAFHRRFAHDAFRFVGAAAAKTKSDRVWVPKCGWVRFRASRKWVGRVSSVSISRVADRWYVSLQCTVEVAEPALREGPWLGIDVGIARYATLSDGSHCPAINALQGQRRRLAHLQRRVARKAKGSRRRKKAALRVARMHQKIANMRADHAHRVSTQLVKNHGRIRMEDLRLVNMMKSARGTVENPGKQVAAKRGLNRRLADQGLRMLRSFVEYKLQWSGGTFEAVPAHHTSQRCHACGHTARENRLSQARFLCVKCGHIDHADVNAAKNIRDTAAGVSRSERTSRRRHQPACEACTPNAA